MTGEGKRMLAALLARVQPSLGAQASSPQKNVHPLYHLSSPDQLTLGARSAGLRPALKFGFFINAGR